MKIVDPKNLFVAIHSQLFRSKKRISPNSAFINLQKYFDKILVVDDDDDERPSILLVIDEIDVLVTKKQTILYRLFDWTTKDSSKLTILAIANTLDLPERMLSHRISSRFVKFFLIVSFKVSNLSYSLGPKSSLFSTLFAFTNWGNFTKSFKKLPFVRKCRVAIDCA